VLFLMHPWLGWAGVGFCRCSDVAGAGHPATDIAPPEQATQELAIESNQVLQAKMRNAETVEAMGMLADLRRQWLDAHDKQTGSQADRRRRSIASRRS
jgi:ABC-type protease/lipase transport system fused ATPase/permease subunit